MNSFMELCRIPACPKCKRKSLALYLLGVGSRNTSCFSCSLNSNFEDRQVFERLEGTIDSEFENIFDL